MPTRSATITVRVSIVRPWLGSVKPTASNSEKRPLARPSPTKRPVTEASTPITVASISTLRSTWRRDAPIVRSVANSRVRCAIVIDSALEMTNAPTNSAMPPNASRNFCRKPMNDCVSDESAAACASPLFTCVCGGRIARMRAIRVVGATPLLPDTRIWSSRPTLPNSCCAVVRSKPERVAPPRLAAAPNLTRPDTRKGAASFCAWMRTVLPTSICFFEAVSTSITTSPACGQSPLESVSELNCGCDGSTEKPRFGAPPKVIDLPFLPMMCASPPTPPMAAATPLTCCTLSSRPASNDGTSAAPPESPSAETPVIAASVPR